MINLGIATVLGHEVPDVGFWFSTTPAFHRDERASRVADGPSQSLEAARLWWAYIVLWADRHLTPANATVAVPIGLPGMIFPSLVDPCP